MEKTGLSHDEANLVFVFMAQGNLAVNRLLGWRRNPDFERAQRLLRAFSQAGLAGIGQRYARLLQIEWTAISRCQRRGCSAPCSQSRGGSKYFTSFSQDFDWWYYSDEDYVEPVTSDPSGLFGSLG